MADKPSYLGLLNAIAVGEGRAYTLLDAWAKATPDAAVAAVLNLVAIREREHAAAFTKRLCELGFGIKVAPRGDFDVKLEFVRSDAGDRDKFESVLGYGKTERPDDPLAAVFSDQSIDVQTGELLGRYIAEERDSERRLRECYSSLGKEKETPADQALAEICARLERLTASIEELKSLRRH